jgi:hypothetical protein
VVIWLNHNHCEQQWNKEIVVHCTEWPKTSVNPKHFLVLTGVFKFKPASQSAERYHSFASR